MMTPELNHRATPEDRWAATADLSMPAAAVVASAASS
jgi:hypothetical protein